MARPEQNATAAANGAGRGSKRVVRAADLEWFWCDGQSVFESSSFGAVVERQAHFGQRAKPCDRCNGTGIAVDGTWCRTCKGFGSRPERLSLKGCVKPGGLLFSTRRCGACRGRTGFTSCPLCHGEGAIDAAPVGYSASPHDEPSYTPNENDLTRYAQVSRWLLRMPAFGVRVLKDYYGLEGYRWGGTKWGRLMSVVPHTEAGRELLERLQNPMRLSGHALLANALDRIDRNTDVVKRQAARARVAVATHEAKRIFEWACAGWNAAVNASRSRGTP